MLTGDLVKKIRETKNLTQKGLADVLGISFATVNRWERGETKPQGANREKLRRYCTANGIQVETGNRTGLKLVTASHLQSWFCQKQNLARGLFPELIEKLIKNSVSDVVEIRFPSGDDINLGGVDGELTVRVSRSPFVPEGHSWWEIGATTVNGRKKIRDDFNNRTERTPASEQKDITLVLVSPQRFNDKFKKERSFKEQSHWKAVRIIDGVDIEEWLSDCFSVSVWLYEQFNEGVYLNVCSVKEAEKRIREATTPESSLRLYTAERKNEIASLKEMMKTKRTIKIAGPSFTEAYRFAVSVLAQDEFSSTNTIVCEDYQSLVSLDNNVRGIGFILNFAIQDDLQMNPENTHVVILGNDTCGTRADITLSRRPKPVFYEVLKKDMSLTESGIQAVLHRAENNVLLIAAALANENCLHSVKWPSDCFAETLIPVAIAGRIDLNNDSEKDVLRRFMPKHMSVEEYMADLKLHWVKTDNSPIYVYKNIVKVTMKEEIWIRYGESCSCHLNTIFEILDEMLIGEDREQSMSEDKSVHSHPWMKQRGCSGELIEGLFDSIILSAIHNGKQQDVDDFVGKLLGKIDSRNKILSISRYLPLIVEASPCKFVDYVGKCLNKEGNILTELFVKKPDMYRLFRRRKYMDLLDALEKLTYIEETKIAACDCLYKLGRYDFKYDNSGNPRDSLISSLHFLKKNALTFSEKIETINQLVENYKEEAFYIPMEIVKKHILFLSYPLSTLKWRNAVILEYDSNNKEIADGYKNLLLNVLDNIKGKDTKTLERLFEVETVYLYLIMDQLKEHIMRNYAEDDQDRLRLYEFLLNKSYFYSTHSKDAAMRELSECLDETIRNIRPGDELKRNLVYFKDFSYGGCPDKSVSDDDHKKMAAKSLEFRKKVFLRLSKKYTPEYTLVNILKVVPDNIFAGREFYRIVPDMNESDFITENCVLRRKYGFLAGYIDMFDNDKIDAIVDSLDFDEAEELAEHFSRNTYVPNRFLTNEAFLEKIYKKREIFYCKSEDEKKLVMRYNPGNYLRWLSLNKEQINSSNIDEICDFLLSLDEDTLISNLNLNYYEIQSVLKKIDSEYNGDRVLQVCVKYLPFFDLNKIPSSIERYYYKHPDEYISFITDRNNDMHLLLCFNNFMALPEGFQTDKEALQSYTDSFMKYTFESMNTVNLVRSSLGQILARSFGTGSEEWLEDDFKKIIEKYADEQLNYGIVVGYFNAQGIKTVGDGTEETVVYKKLMRQSRANRIKYPESARVLEAIADNYKKTAESDKEFMLKFNGLI